MENVTPSVIGLKKSTVALIAAALIVGLVAGYFAGSFEGERAANTRLAPMVDLAFPKPPSEMYALTGKILGVYGATVKLEIDNVDDYLPHPDQSARAKETRNANITSATSYAIIDFSKLDAAGNPARSIFALADLKEGEIVTVRSAENIRNAESFDVIAVERIAY
ncbi:MAG: hypothetical protein HYU81_02715 [Candidatus Brennerbacteria bacterium]|nr:hypothetical protein [Candidatus Brennerbacteria bacterium]